MVGYIHQTAFNKISMWKGIIISSDGQVTDLCPPPPSLVIIYLLPWLGIIYVTDCPLQPFVPIFIIIGGLAGVIKTVLLLSENVMRKNAVAISTRLRHPKLLVRFWRVSNVIFDVFMLSWMVAGSYWIYSIYRQVVVTDYSTCNVVLYKISFSFVTCSYVLVLLVFSWTAYLGISALMRRRKRVSRSTNEGAGDDQRGGGGSAEEEGGHVTSVDRGEQAVSVALEGTVLEGVVSAVPHNEPGVGVEVVASDDVGVVPIEGEASNEGTDNRRRDNIPASSAEERVGDRISDVDHVDNVFHSSPHLDRHPSAPSHQPTTAFRLHRYHSATTTSVQYHSNIEATSSPHLHQPNGEANLSSAHLQVPSCQQHHRTSLRLESVPYQTSIQQSFGSNGFGVLSNPFMQSAVSASTLQVPAQKDTTHTHSVPSLVESHSFYLDLTGSRDHLYNTVHTEGYSITAV
jgi:hypothetical protein